MRIAVTSSFSQWGSWSPDFFFNPGAQGMVAGGETAMCQLSFQLAKRGHTVFLFYDVAKPQRYRGVDFLPKSYGPELLTSMDFDVLIAWEDLQSPSMNHTADLVVLPHQNNAMMTGILSYSIDYYQAVSKWHAEQLKSSDPTLLPSSESKWVVFPNGVDLARYKNPPAERHSFRIIHSSSPDRGLHHLIRMWPDIKKAVPEAELRIFYEMGRWFALADARPDLITSERARNLKQLLHGQEGNGVYVMGAVNQWRLAQEQMAASLCVYPCSPIQPTEGFGITILEALAAGTPVITTDADAFPELWSEVTRQIPLPIENKEDSWVRAIHYLLTDKTAWQEASMKGRTHAKQFTWDRIGRDYEKWIKDALWGERGLAVAAAERLAAIP